MGTCIKTLKSLNIIRSKVNFYKNRSNRPEVFCKKGVLRNFTKFTGKHLCQSLLFNKVAALRPKKDVEKFGLFRADTVKILVTIEKLLILHLVAFMPGLSKWLDY